ncbi:MAG TPA: outer membrane lipoprotein carrier protein LolA [Xanthobacteraceae bacterium]|nr:outer membrane lipoprotein carrier protein LolA [Xanthobacteraceae bacterium]
MQSPALLIGICLALAPVAASAQPTPVPPAQKKSTVPPPPVTQNSGPRAQPAPPAQSNNLFPFKIPGFSNPGTTTAFDGNQRALIDRVNMYLMSVQTMIGDFVQVGPDGRRSEGKLYLQKPGRIRFEYNPPSPIELVADGNSVVIRDRKLDTQDLYPLSQTPLRFLLADRIDLLRETNVVSVSADDTFLSLLLEEKHTLGGTHKVLLMFSAKDTQLKQWTVTDPQGYDTTVALYNLDLGKKLDPSMFVINYERKEIIQ